MYILPMLTHLEVVALGGRSDIFFFQHFNCESNCRLTEKPVGRPSVSPNRFGEAMVHAGVFAEDCCRWDFFRSAFSGFVVEERRRKYV